VYHQPVRRINIHLDDELDAELAAEAARTGESKASLIRRAARAWLDRRLEEAPDEAWASFTGAITTASRDDRPDDDVIYRP
jgi:Arc/MetJ family transcription regulator